jgi:Fe-S-cluster containining protein
MSRSLFVQADRWFDRSRSALGGELPCRRGCFRCCIGPFTITIVDALELRRGLAALDIETRQDIAQRAECQAQAMEAVAPTLANSPFVDAWDDQMVDSVLERFQDIRCPALGDDGSCRVYQFRPVTCRVMGIPIEDAGGVTQGACAIQVAVPILRLPSLLRQEEDRLAADEAAAIDMVGPTKSDGTELLLPYGFLPAAGGSSPSEEERSGRRLLA